MTINSLGRFQEGAEEYRILLTLKIDKLRQSQYEIMEEGVTQHVVDRRYV